MLMMIVLVFSVLNSVIGYWNVFGSMIVMWLLGFMLRFCRYDVNVLIFCVSV